MSQYDFLGLKTAIAQVCGSLIGTYQGSEKMFTSIGDVFSQPMLDEYAQRVVPVPDILDPTKLCRLPAVWIRNVDPPTDQVIDGSEIIVDHFVHGYFNGPTTPYVKATVVNHGTASVLAGFMELLHNSWHPRVIVTGSPVHIPRRGVYNERIELKLIAGTGGYRVG